MAQGPTDCHSPGVTPTSVDVVDDPGPYFDDLEVGQRLQPGPAVTIGAGEAAVYQAVCGDPMATSLDRLLGEAVTGRSGRLVNPGLVMHVSIGQSTVATRRVIANLFYRGVALRRPVWEGETLHTEVTIRGLAELRRRSDRPARGLALLGIRTTCVDDGKTVVDYERCAMLLVRDPAILTGQADDLGVVDLAVDLDAWEDRIPTGWDPSPLAGMADQGWAISDRRTDRLRDTVTDALLLVRLTQNQAPPHRDPAEGPKGQRLVYGGHTIGLAQASLTRMMPGTATIVGWQSCDHLAPVYEEDVLAFHHTLLDERSVGAGRLRAVRVEVDTDRDGEPTPVLDWRTIVWGA